MKPPPKDQEVDKWLTAFAAWEKRHQLGKAWLESKREEDGEFCQRMDRRYWAPRKGPVELVLQVLAFPFTVLVIPLVFVFHFVRALGRE